MRSCIFYQHDVCLSVFFLIVCPHCPVLDSIKIISIYSARKSYDNGPILRHTLPSLEKQPFAFVTTVSWKFLRPEYGVVKKPPPTLIFSVPHDVFYPFELGKSGAMSSNRRLGIWSGAVFIMSVLLFVNIIF